MYQIFNKFTFVLPLLLTKCQFFINLPFQYSVTMFVPCEKVAFFN